MRKHLLFSIIVVGLTFFQGCLPLLELAAVEDLGAAGMAVEDMGILRVVNEELVTEEMAGVRMAEAGELSVWRNGSVQEFGELISEDKILLRSGKIVRLPGIAYRVGEDVYVRNSPFSGSTSVFGEQLKTGQLVMVNDNFNGWYEVMLPNHEFGFIPVSSAKIAETKHSKSHSGVAKHTGFRKGVNYIANKSFVNTPDAKELIVNITFDDGTFDENSSIKINSFAVNNGYRSTPGFFSTNYYVDELNNQLMLGNIDYINKLDLYHHADYLLIGSYKIKLRENRLQKDMLTSEMSYKVNLINLKTGTIEKTYVNNITGSGWGDFDTRNDVLQAFYQVMENNKF